MNLWTSPVLNTINPESFGLPPTGTIVCMAKRLAEHLAGEKPN
jgi:hypothetical protein